MKCQLTETEADEILDYLVNNPDFTVGESMAKFKITKDMAFNLVKQAGNKLGKL